MEPVAFVTLAIVALTVVVLAVSLIAVAVVLRGASSRLEVVAGALGPSPERTDTTYAAIDDINHDLERGRASLEDLLDGLGGPRGFEAPTQPLKPPGPGMPAAPPEE